MIEPEVEALRLHMELSDADLAARQPTVTARGHAHLLVEHVERADTGADLSLLKGMRGSEVPRDSH